jgi:hypothetical protein
LMREGAYDYLPAIVDKKRWGYPFRRGLFEVTRRDFERIACAMGQRGPRRGARTGGRRA